VFRTSGFATALVIAQPALTFAHVEAKCAINCIDLVKLMGRDAGQHRRPPAERPDGPLRRPQRDGRRR